MLSQALLCEALVAVMKGGIPPRCILGLCGLGCTYASLMLAIGVEVKPIDESRGDVNIGIRLGIQFTFHRVQRRR